MTCTIANAMTTVATMALVSFLLVAPPSATADGSGAPPPSGEMGFIISKFTTALYPGMKDNCPNGWSGTVNENYLATLPPKERARLLLPANEPELTQRWKAYAVRPDGTNICTNYDQFPEHGPIKNTVQGKISYGINLDDDDGDGSKNPNVCSHQTFTSPTGEKGIDNQAYRAMGCGRAARAPDGGPGEVAGASQQTLARGEHTMVLLLRGVDSLVNDDDVEVILATSLDQPIVDTKLNFIANASYWVSPNMRWRNVLKGRIHDGVLTTAAADITLKKTLGVGGARGERAEYDLTRGRLQLTIKPDGSLEGVMGGYQPLFDMIATPVYGGRGSALTGGIDCAATWATLNKLADGGRDPKTGKCTTISSAYEMKAMPAFIFDHPPASTTTAAR